MAAVDACDGDVTHGNRMMPTQISERRDRAICRILETNPSELERILERSRQTILKYLEQNRLFGVEEVVRVASQKIADEAVRSRTVAAILKDWFPEVLRYTRDRDFGRFSRYAIFGMHVAAELAANPAFEAFIRSILSAERKFVLFVCRPHREHIQLSRWLENFAREKSRRTASFALLPCKLMELAPIQIIAEPWSTDPKFIHLTPDDLFVDEANAKRAAQLAGALMDYGLSERACETIEDQDVVKGLVRNLNSSFYQDAEIKQSRPLVFVNPALSAEANDAQSG
jgi:hypothetical protein